MSGMSGQEMEFRRRAIDLPYWHNESLEQQAGRLACGTPYEILLGILCHSNANVDSAAAFFRSLYETHPDAVACYLKGFIARLHEECDTHNCELRATPAKRMTPIDFPRPSPTLLLVWDFARQLARDSALYADLCKASGADWFFHTTRQE
jgi:hypothetical protein